MSHYRLHQRIQHCLSNLFSGAAWITEHTVRGYGSKPSRHDGLRIDAAYESSCGSVKVDHLRRHHEHLGRLGQIGVRYRRVAASESWQGRQQSSGRNVDIRERRDTCVSSCGSPVRDRSVIATVAGEDDKAGKAVPRKARHISVQKLEEKVSRDGDRAGKGHVVIGEARPDYRCDQCVPELPRHPNRNFLAQERVCAFGKMWTMLFCCAGDDHRGLVTGLDEVFNVDPGQPLQSQFLTGPSGRSGLRPCRSPLVASISGRRQERP